MDFFDNSSAFFEINEIFSSPDGYYKQKGKCRMQDNTYFSDLAEKYKNCIYRIAFNYLMEASSCDDVVQDTLLKLYLTDKKFESEEHVKHWIIRVAINECKKMLRSPWHARENIVDFEEAFSYEDKEQIDLLEALAKIDKKYRIVLYLYYYEGYKTDEIGKLLGVPSATVITRLSRARKILRMDLEDEK